MNNYDLYKFENIDDSLKNGIGILKPINEYKKNIKYLFEGLGNAKPIDEIPDKLYRDEFMEQDIEIDISSNKFREVWEKYEKMYNENNETNNEQLLSIKKEENNVIYSDEVDELYAKIKELDNYLVKLSEERKEIDDKKELLELTERELEQQKELLNIEKEEFEEYKKDENEKIKRDKIKFQNMVEEMKNKIEAILS